MKPLIANGQAWEEATTSAGGKKKWVSEDGHFEIFLTATGKYRLVAFEHEASTQFPDAEFWMREYATLDDAATQAEKM